VFAAAQSEHKSQPVRAISRAGFFSGWFFFGLVFFRAGFFSGWFFIAMLLAPPDGLPEEVGSAR
jgi:hypothetical protein